MRTWPALFIRYPILHSSSPRSRKLSLLLRALRSRGIIFPSCKYLCTVIAINSVADILCDGRKEEEKKEPCMNQSVISGCIWQMGPMRTLRRRCWYEHVCHTCVARQRSMPLSERAEISIFEVCHNSTSFMFITASS